MSAPIEAYLAHLRSTLAAWRPLLLEELARIVHARFPPEVDLVHFEFFDDSLCEPAFPFFLYAYHQKEGVQSYSTPLPTARKVFQPTRTGEASAYFPTWYHLLSNEHRPLVDPALWTEVGESTGYAFLGEESQLVHDWFVACWQEAGGPSFPVNCYLFRVYAEEENEAFDLRACHPVEWAAIWT